MAYEFGAGMIVAVPHQVQPMLEFRGRIAWDHLSLSGRGFFLATLRHFLPPIHATEKAER
jgi:hypothetical protein